MSANEAGLPANANNASPTQVPPWSFLPEGFSNIQLDIVGFLAILGEASVLSNSQVAALSWTYCLPRLVPAPQALIRTQRPKRLQTSSAIVIGPHSGNIRHHINHITQILHQIAFHENKIPDPEVTPYSVAAITIDWAPHMAEGASTKKADKAAEPDKEAVQDSANKNKDAAVKIHKASTGHWATKLLKLPSNSKTKQQAKKLVATSRSFGWQARLTFLGCSMSIGLFVASCRYGDGMSVLAILLLSFLSSLVGIVNFYTLKLPERTQKRTSLPSSDVVVYYPNGSFLVVNCPEEISRLYFQSEQCNYLIKSHWQYRSICLVATLFLMLGVICLANATEWLQVAWAGCYIILNAAYWAVAALPGRKNWDMSSFKVGKAAFKWHKFTDEGKDPSDPGKARYSSRLYMDTDHSEKATFTEALWKAIGVTRGSMWARTADIAPATPDWDDWLREAERQASRGTEEPNSPSSRSSSNTSDPPKRNGMGFYAGIGINRIRHRDRILEKNGKIDLESGPVASKTTLSSPSKSKHETTQDRSENTLILPKWNYTAELTGFLRNGRSPRWAVTTVSTGVDLRSTANTEITAIAT